MSQREKCSLLIIKASLCLHHPPFYQPKKLKKPRQTHTHKKKKTKKQKKNFHLRTLKPLIHKTTHHHNSLTMDLENHKKLKRYPTHITGSMKPSTTRTKIT